MKRRQSGSGFCMSSGDVRTVSAIKSIDRDLSVSSATTLHLNNLVTASLSLLNDQVCQNPNEKVFALRTLKSLVRKHWHEIAEFLPCLEALIQQPSFPEHKLAAFVTAETYYCMNEFRNAMDFALLADDLFEEVVDSGEHCDFVRCVLSQCIEIYGRARRRVFSLNATLDLVAIEEIYEEERVCRKIEAIVERMVEQAIQGGNEKLALGLCIDTRRLDLIRSILNKANPTVKSELVLFLYKSIGYDGANFSSVDDDRFKRHCYLIMAETAYECDKWDHYFIVDCLYQANQPKRIANCLHYILQMDRPDIEASPPETAFQIVLDLLDHTTQAFMNVVRVAFIKQSSFCVGAEPEYQDTVTMNNDLAPFFIKGLSDRDFILSEDHIRPVATLNHTLAYVDTNDHIFDSITDEDIRFPTEGPHVHFNEADRLFRLMNNRQRLSIIFQSLVRHNCASLSLLKQIKDCTRGTLGQSGIVIANGLMHAGTTCDSFLRDNLEWLSHASCWAKFSATASLGLIHRFHELESLRLMEAYLPRDNASNSPGDSPYAEGGGLYAIGLIYAGHEAGELRIPSAIQTVIHRETGSEIRTSTQYLIYCLERATNKVVKHGACLGIGLSGLCSRQRRTADILKRFLSDDEAIVGEAAALALGMTMAGPSCTATDTIDFDIVDALLRVAESSTHDKVVRGVGMAIAILATGKRNQVWELVAKLENYNSSFIRRAIPMSIAMAFVASGNYDVIERLLSWAVNDVSDDVRRAACEGIGFVMYERNAYMILNIVNLLKESYNPHVRFGACVALGISCMSSGNQEIVDALQTSLNDPVSFVRVAANLALAMVYNDVGETLTPAGSNQSDTTTTQLRGIRQFRMQLMKQVSDKLEDSIVRYSSIVSYGILDAFGRNAHLSLVSEKEGGSNLVNYQACIGALLFTQFWYWFPLTHMLALAYKPDSICAVTRNMEVPDIKLYSNEELTEFTYVPTIEEKRIPDKRSDRLEAAMIASSRQRRRAGYTALARAVNRTQRQAVAASAKKAAAQESSSATKLPDNTILTLKAGEPHPPRSSPLNLSTNPATYAQISGNQVSIKNLTPVRRDNVMTIFLPNDQKRFQLLKTVYEGVLPCNFVVLVDTVPDEMVECISVVDTVQEADTKQASEEAEPPSEFQWNEDEGVDNDTEKMDVDEKGGAAKNSSPPPPTPDDAEKQE